MSERFPSKMIAGGGQSSRMPRILCQFDGWGVSNRRCGGGSSAEYEFVKFVGIVRFIDAPHPVAKHIVEYPIAPHFFSKPDDTVSPRLSSPRDIKKRDRPLSGK